MNLLRKLVGSNWVIPVLLVMVAILSACRTDEQGLLLPADEDPAISITSPTNPNLLLKPGEPFNVTFKLFDNESLKVFRVVARVLDENNVNTGGDAIILDSLITGRNVNLTYNTTAPQLPSYYKVRFFCFAIDTKGASAFASFIISILPPDPDPSPFEVLSYSNNLLFNRRLNLKYAFNFTARQDFPASGNQGSPLEFDIAEDSNSGLTFWEPVLISPNNDLLGRDSVFVMTDASRFNYENATYESIYQAWHSDPLPSPRTPILKKDDYVIIRLTKAPFPQFAVMRITNLIDDGGGQVQDAIQFDYKVTTQ